MTRRSEVAKVGVVAAGGMLACCSLTAFVAAGGLASVAACVGGVPGLVLITVGAVGLGAYLWRRRNNSPSPSPSPSPSAASAEDPAVDAVAAVRERAEHQLSSAPRGGVGGC